MKRAALQHLFRSAVLAVTPVSLALGAYACGTEDPFVTNLGPSEAGCSPLPALVSSFDAAILEVDPSGVVAPTPPLLPNDGGSQAIALRNRALESADILRR